MFFYEDLLKEIDKTKPNEKEYQVYGAEFRRLVVWLGTGIPLILLGGLQVVIGYQKNYNPIYIIVGAGLIFLGLKHLKTIFSYKIILDLKKQLLKYQNIVIEFSDIERCCLKENVVGKMGKLQVVVRIVTLKKEEYIIPVVMSKKKLFIATLKNSLKERFHIER